MAGAENEYLKAMLGDIPDPALSDEHIGANAKLLKRIYEEGGMTGGSKLDINILDELPSVGEQNVLYLIPKANTSSEEGIYNKYVWVQSKNEFVYLGDTHVEVDVSEYVKNSDLESMKKTVTYTDEDGNTGTFYVL